TGYLMVAASRFFFQAEDGIRVFHVTGVQTCALPISSRGQGTRTPRCPRRHKVSTSKCVLTCGFALGDERSPSEHENPYTPSGGRSEERRVGKEVRTRGGVRPEKDTSRSEIKVRDTAM